MTKILFAWIDHQTENSIPEGTAGAGLFSQAPRTACVKGGETALHSGLPGHRPMFRETVKTGCHVFSLMHMRHDLCPSKTHFRMKPKKFL
ncbi:MAG: hypothetical protein B6245_11920 [Desulfobacteraceae bacterium 4572_88]|nr:MAG: hypothetical protein B6245_11920 [Desulfobacteraceae bacterium 4572_88]